MKFHSAHKSLASWLVAVAAGFVVAACGGGGSTTTNTPDQGGQPILSPANATVYAGVPTTFVVTGGRRPYTVTSSEPTTLPVPQTVDSGSFQVVAANPGVIDLNLPDGALPVRTVNIELRDARGQSAPPIQVKVARNFLTGYGFSLSSNCPSTGSTPVPVCSGGETALRLAPMTNGNLFGDRPVRFQVMRGPIQFLYPSGALDNFIDTKTDHAGIATVIFRVNANVTAQLAVIRVIDIATGVYVDNVVAISGVRVSTTLTAIPNEFTFTGPISTQCGTGSADFLVFDGQPPYTAISSDPNLRVSPTTTDANPARFTLTAFNSSVCMTDATIIITDSAGGRTTVKVTTSPGSITPPAPPPLAVAPTTITLGCGMSGSVSVVGGISSSYLVNSTNSRVVAVVSGNTITITRLGGDPVGSSFPTTAGISVSDGAAVQTVTASVPAFCP